MIGLSTAALPQPQVLVAPASPTSTTPGINTQFFDSSFSHFTSQDNSSGFLRYPLDTPKYILTFTISKYSRSSISSVGTFQTAPGYPAIILPLPEQLVDLDAVNWEEYALGTLAGATVSGAVNQASQGNLGGALAAGAAGIGIAAGQGILSNLSSGLSDAALNTASTITQALGLSPNQFVTLLMRGPRYKRHRFSWTFAPNNFKEADELRKIIRVFRNGMSPGIWGTILNAPVVWTYPKIFWLRFYPNSKFMYKFKPCIIDSFAVNYTPGNKAAFDRNGTGVIGDNPPSCIQMQMELIELEFWVEGNYDGSNDPDNVDELATQPVSGEDVINQIKNNFNPQTPG